MIGIDLGQFASDPFGSGVQRVLQQLARTWPQDVEAEFVVPFEGGFGALRPSDAYVLISTTFEQRPADHEAPILIAHKIAELTPAPLAPDTLSHRYTSWLLPEMSYDPVVHARVRHLAQSMPLTMIGYDALPMSNPENYFFSPGIYEHVSEYFRLLRDADNVVCISEFSQSQLFETLHRDDTKSTSVAHLGGDHVSAMRHLVPEGPPVFLRLGTLEARKKPVEITTAFCHAVDQGLDAHLVFVGSPSRVDVAVNASVQQAVDRGYPVTWVTHATDAEVLDWITRAHAFLSFGIEGFGIPVLEVLRRGLPVVFNGVQPAAQIMEGRGAERHELKSDPDMWRTYAAFAQRATSIIDPDSVPRWEDFASAVAESAR